MTKAPAAPKAKAPAPKPAFNVATMGRLNTATGTGDGELKRALLVDIEEDPNQPRKIFSESSLARMTASVKAKGVLQPVGLRPGAKPGKWILVWGARRYRSSKMAGLADIPYVVAKEGQRDFVSQVIENQQREDLANSELAAAVIQVAGEGMKNKEIAELFNLKDYQVSGYRAVDRFPKLLTDRLDRSDIRGLYDVFRLWEKSPEAVELALHVYPEGLSYGDAQRVISGVTGKAQNNNFVTKSAEEPGITATGPGAAILPGSTTVTVVAPARAPDVDQGEEALQPAKAPAPSQQVPASLREDRPAPSPQAKEAARAALNVALAGALGGSEVLKVFVAGADGEIGRLITTERPKEAGHVIVAYEAFREEVPVDGLKIVGVE